MRFRLINSKLAIIIFGVSLWILPISYNPAFAQSANSMTIARIDVQGNKRIEAQTIQSYMLISSGEPYSSRLVDQSLKRLFATGLFADVVIRRHGNVLVVSVIENPIINRLAFEGNRRIEDLELEAEVQLRPRIVYTRSRVQADVQRILQVYRRSGRFAASVDPKVVQLEQNRVDLIFEINEGPVTKIQRINFVGNKRFSDSKLRSVMATKESRWYRFFSSYDTYDPDRITLDRELLRKFYLEEGFADFRVLSAVADLSHDRSSFFITFTLEEGDIYKFGRVDLSSTLKDLDPNSLISFLTVTPGETYNAEEIERTISKLNAAVGQLGYAFVDIRPRVIRHKDDRMLDLVFEINEGQRVYIDRVNIVGNVRTLDRVVRRELEVVEGDAYNTTKLRESRRKIQRLGFFDKVDLRKKQGEMPDKAIVDVNLQERSTGELSFGIGLSTTESVLGDISIRERNLLGKGQSLRLKLGLSATRQEIDLSFTEPYFLDRNLAVGFDIFNRIKDQQDRSSYDEESQGFSIRSKFPITDNLKQSVKYTLRNDKIENLDNTTSEFIRIDEGDFITSSLGYLLTYDTRDDINLPTTGIVIRGTQEIAGLGGDIRYIKSTANLTYFYPFFRDVVGNISLVGGAIYGLDQDIRVLNRFFLGGDSFRGFKSGGVGPRDVVTDDAIGGNTVVTLTGELRFPIGLPNEYGVLGRAYTVVGTLLNPDVSGINLQESNSFRQSVGVGLSWRSPFGPIRVDLALPVIKENFDEEEPFRFSFGTNF